MSENVEAPGHNPNHQAYLVPGLQRGLLVLEAIAEAGRPLSVTEIGTRLSLNRSGVFRLTYTLRQLGFLEAVEGTKLFQLGPRILNVGFAFLASRDIIEIAQPELILLRDRTNISSHLTIRDARDVLFLHCVQSTSGFHSNMNVGTRLPAYASPMGWLLLSDLPKPDLAKLFGATRFEPLTDRTPLDLQSLVRRVGEAGAQGHVVSSGFMEVGGCSISAPVFDGTGKVVGAIDVSGPESAFDQDRMDEGYVSEVLAAAARISAKLGFRRDPSIS